MGHPPETLGGKANGRGGHEGQKGGGGVPRRQDPPYNDERKEKGKKKRGPSML